MSVEMKAATSTSDYAAYRNPLVSVTMASTFFLKLVSFLCIPFMTIYLSRNVDAPPYIIGVIVGLSQIGSLTAGFFSGVLADRVGKRLILLVGLFGSALVFLLFFLAATFLRGSSLFAVAFGLLNAGYGVMSAFFWPVTQVLMADSLPKERRPALFRHRYVLTNFAVGIGPPAGAFLGIASARAAFVISGCSYLVFAVAFWWLTRGTGFGVPGGPPEERRSFTGAIRVLGADRVFRGLTVSMILFTLAYCQIATNLSAIVSSGFSDGVRFFAILLTVNAAAVIALQPIATAISKRLSPRRTILLGNALFAVVCLLFSLVAFGKTGLITLIVLISMAEVLVVPTVSVVVDELAPPAMRGTYFGAATLRNLGLGAGPAAGGLVLASFDRGLLFVFMGLCGVAACAVVYFTLRENTGADTGPSPEPV
ncbi:MFS transporter [Streptomyces sp. ISL-100]|uniref:MFS transporter n=1 Tax=Streptomyces sp. ISL-100 TaxID=2819173 RepID=UPI001BE9A1BF|nr:MFS transporter [Streptomyces sp. ISL-100]MBT2399359.1 MFS transporter [Streptomyces sp. ISL-100]